jgi:hypothetical protein
LPYQFYSRVVQPAVREYGAARQRAPAREVREAAAGLFDDD